MNATVTMTTLRGLRKITEICNWRVAVPQSVLSYTGFS